MSDFTVACRTGILLHISCERRQVQSMSHMRLELCSTLTSKMQKNACSKVNPGGSAVHAAICHWNMSTKVIYSRSRLSWMLQTNGMVTSVSHGHWSMT